jgi:hypothetical protein
MRFSNLKFTRTALPLLALLLLIAAQGGAVSFTLASAGPTTWTYNLVLAPFDNCNLFVSPTKIVLTGLTGVTGAGAPTTTDFPAGALATNMLNWVPTFTSTSVTWTDSVCGTGNFGVTKNVNGFTFTAPVAQSPTITVTTTGFAKDTGIANSLDISGPIPSGAAPVPVMSPIALLLTMIGLGCAGAWEQRRRLQSWFAREA